MSFLILSWISSWIWRPRILFLLQLHDSDENTAGYVAVQLYTGCTVEFENACYHWELSAPSWWWTDLLPAGRNSGAQLPWCALTAVHSHHSTPFSLTLFLRFFFPLSNLTRPVQADLYQNQRRVWVSRDLKGHLVPTSPPWPGTLSTRPKAPSSLVHSNRKDWSPQYFFSGTLGAPTVLLLKINNRYVDVVPNTQELRYVQRTDWSLAPTRQLQKASTWTLKTTVLIFSVLFEKKKIKIFFKKEREKKGRERKNQNIL